VPTTRKQSAACAPNTPGNGSRDKTRRAVGRETAMARTDSRQAPARPANSRTTAPIRALNRGVQR